MNTIHDKIYVSPDIVNLVQDIRNNCPNRKEVNIVYSIRECNRDSDRVVESSHK